MDITDKIKSMKHTRVEAEIAEYILAHVDTVGIMTVLDLAEEIGVSDTSIIRFVRKLGYRGYGEFRAEMTSRLAEQYIKSQEVLLPGEKYVRSQKTRRNEGIIHEVSTSVLNNLKRMVEQLDEETIVSVAKILLESRRKYIAGFRGTASCAVYMATRLLLLLPDVRALTTADASAAQTLIDSNEQDCLLLFSFPRYSEICSHLIELARQNGTRIILITDRMINELSDSADVTIAASVDAPGFVNSYVAPIALIDMLLLAVGSMGGGECSSRIQKLDAAMDNYKLY